MKQILGFELIPRVIETRCVLQEGVVLVVPRWVAEQVLECLVDAVAGEVVCSLKVIIVVVETTSSVWPLAQD